MASAHDADVEKVERAARAIDTAAERSYGMPTRLTWAGLTWADLS